MSSNFKEFRDKHGIKREYTIPGTPKQNGVVERQKKNSSANGQVKDE
jgi:transposase InsO family protein